MVNTTAWRVVPDEEAARLWDRWLADFLEPHIRQSHVWALHKKGGWQPLFTALFSGSVPTAMGLCLVKKAPLGAATVVWINGGPLFRKARPRGQDLAALEGYLKGLKEHVSTLPAAVLRLNAEIPMDVEAQLILRQAGFLRPLMPLGTGLTYVMDLGKSLEDIREDLERKWRNQLKRSDEAALKIDTGRDRALLERYLPLHNALCERKRLAALKLSPAQLEKMARDLGEHITFFVLSCEGRDGCGGALWTFGGTGWCAMSSADDWGLKRNLPNAMYWHMLKLLKESGAARFDLAGIDPRSNWGVYNFKRGLNLPPVEVLGEWEWSASDWRRRFFNAALWLRRDKLL